MNQQDRSNLVKGLTTLGLIAVLLISYQSFNMSAFTGDWYAPGAAAPMQSLESVFIYGTVFSWNDTIGDYIPVINIQIRIWATDELVEDIITTDSTGRYESNIKFWTGQLITLTIGNERFTRFISYHAEDSYELDGILLS